MIILEEDWNGLQKSRNRRAAAKRRREVIYIRVLVGTGMLCWSLWCLVWALEH